MAKNANGEGSIHKRMRDGKVLCYQGAISYAADDGSTKRHTVYGRTRQDVRDKLRQARERLDAGAPVRDATRTVADWLAQWRATTLAASNRKEATRELYANLSRCHLERAPFGAIRLDRLRPSDVEALILAMRAKTKGDPPRRALSDSTIRNVYTVLRAGLDGAVRDGLLARNPVAAVKRPGVARTEAKYSTAVDVTALLRAAEGLRYRPVLSLIAATGLRRGEAVALHWSDVDLDAAVLAVRGTLGRVGGALVVSEPKTERSRRTVPLSPAMVTLLRAHRKQQAAERLHAGDQWQDHGLVFATEAGAPVDPRNILRTIELAADKAGMDRVGVHTLRHSAAVAWLEAGVHIKAVADLLGHSSIAITGDTYGHTSDDAARAAVAALSDALGI
ncbi:integrase [Mycobacterium sp. E136]|uniref:tyrosine-type recombinase/integrase n=1 Tax=Mycobacterium sp. E136 TaxID=1834125 RepID=UPI0008018590|nr:site-specific integrase [Mycobacterium sp. E136]OBG91255.1 integrase [Mycobacterium sp. E136]